MKEIKRITAEEIEKIENTIKKIYVENIDEEKINIIIMYYIQNQNIEKVIEYCSYIEKLGLTEKSKEYYFKFYKENFEDLKRKNTGEALNTLGNMYEIGVGVKQDLELARYYYEQATKKENTKAMCNLAYMFRIGLGVEQDYKKSLEYYEQAAKRKDSSALSNLGLIYYEGIGVEKNNEQAIEYYEQAAEQEKKEAIRTLANIYYEGIVTKQNYEKAFKYYMYLSKQGESLYEIGYRLGYMYEFGLGTQKNYEKALEYYKKSDQKENPEAQYRIGYMYEFGEGVYINYDNALYYYKKAAEKEHKDALYRIGYMYYAGIEDYKDFEIIIDYFELAAKNGNTKGLELLGNTYMKNTTIENNYEKALYYYKKAAEYGSSKAYKEIGYMYEKGLVEKKDFEKALQYYQKAVELGNIEVLLDIAYLYQKQKEYKKTIEILEQAAHQGLIEAQIKLGDIYEKGKITAKNHETALKYYIEAAKQKKGGLLELAQKYEIGDGVEKNYETALYIHEQLYKEGKKDQILNILCIKHYLGKLNQEEYHKLIEQLIQKEEDTYLKKILEKLEKGSEIVVIKNIKDEKLKIKQLNTQNEDTIIVLQTRDNNLFMINSEFYILSDIKKIIRVCQNILKNIDLNQKEEDIFMQIYIKLGNMISYDYEDKQKLINRNLMILLNRIGVCLGYAYALKFILNMVGIETKIIISETLLNQEYEEEGHAYNQVKINGKWYYCDPTWDADKIKQGKIEYCLKSEQSFSTDRMHQALYKSQQEKAEENYQQIQTLFLKNYIKLQRKRIIKNLIKSNKKYTLQEERKIKK